MTHVKRQNRASILRLLYTQGGLSRKDIARQLRLTPAAITLITNDMIKEGLLEEIREESNSSRVGRKEIIIDICYNKFHAIGININIDYTIITCLDLKGKAMFEDRFKTDKSSAPEQLIKYAWDLVEDNLREIPEVKKENIVGIGVGIRGIVDNQKGISLESFGLWDEQVNVKNIFEDITHIPVSVDNNVRSITRGQLFFSKDKPKSLLLVKYGPGIGGALAVQEKLFTGHNYRAIELGHIVVDQLGITCRCNKCGCLETISSYYAIERNIRAVYSEKQTPVLYNLTQGKASNFDIDIIMKSYNGGDIVVRDIITRAMRYLALTLKNVITLLDPQKVILYGEAFENKDFLELAYDFMYEEAYFKNINSIVVKSEFNGCLNSKGPTSLAIESFFNSGGVIYYPTSSENWV